MTEEKELSRERIAPCPFCSHDSEGNGGLYRVVAKIELTQEEWDEWRNKGLSYPREQIKFVCGAGVRDCSIPKTYELAHDANTRDNSEPRFVG